MKDIKIIFKKIKMNIHNINYIFQEDQERLFNQI